MKHFKAGFGHTWAARQIFEYNKFPLELSSNYENLFNMLNKGRFDYFPRGINEAWNELSSRTSTYPQMKVEDTILLYYPMPIYFILNKSSVRLTERVETGLHLSLKDGSFDELFNLYHKDIIEKARLSERKLILLDNPYLPENTPADEMLWLDLIDDLK